MTDLPAFMRSVTPQDVEALLPYWHWLVPDAHEPLLLSVMGDWVFGAPSGELCALSVLDGDYRVVANNSAEFNESKRSFQWLDENFQAGWQEIAFRHELVPGPDECLAWRTPPVVGGAFEVANLQVISHVVYQCVMGQLHQQLRFGRPQA